MSTPLEICEGRDPKSLYARARAGHELHLTGMGDPYEAPEHPDISVSTETLLPDEIARQILSTWLNS